MNLIFRGDCGIAVNPNFICIKSFKEDGKDFYNIRAFYDNGNTWVKLTRTFESHKEAVEALREMHQEAIGKTLGLNCSRDLGEEVLEDKDEY